jgi:hypothetical protein
VSRGATGNPAQRRSALRRFGYLPLGLAGQGFTFASMVVPILLRESEQVLVLVYASAFMALLGNAALLAYPFIYPVVRGPRTAQVATRCSLVALTAASASVALLFPLEEPLGVPAGTFAGAAVLTVTFGYYAVVVTQLVRAGDEIGMGLARLYYGCAVLTASLVASLADIGPLGLTLGTSLSYAVATAALLVRPSARPPLRSTAGRVARRRLRRVYLRRALRPTLGSLAGSWSTFLPGIVLPGLGTAAEPWAIVNRICGGFVTLLSTIVAPPLEGRFSRAVRDRDRAAFRVTRRTGFLLGGGAAAAAVATSLALAVYATDRAAVSDWFVPLTIATVLFWGPLLTGTPVNRLPNFLSRDGQRLFFDAARAALVTAAVLLLSGLGQLIVMGVAMAVTGVLLVPMTRWQAPRGMSSAGQSLSAPSTALR